jgi:hypothetical protein
LWSAWPVLQHAYANLDPAQRPVIEAEFRALTDTVEIGVEAVMYIFGGSWWLLVAYLLGTDRHGLRWTTVALGVMALVASASLLARVSWVATPALGIAFVLTPIWSVWIGLRVLPTNSHLANTAFAQAQDRTRPETFARRESVECNWWTVSRNESRCSAGSATRTYRSVRRDAHHRRMKIAVHEDHHGPVKTAVQGGRRAHHRRPVNAAGKSVR